MPTTEIYIGNSKGAMFSSGDRENDGIGLDNIAVDRLYAALWERTEKIDNTQNVKQIILQTKLGTLLI